MTSTSFVKQRTLKRNIRATGIGIHTGKKISLTLRPAPPDTGIIFRRTDLNPAIEIPACVTNIGDTTLSSCLVKDSVRIATIEHLMSAFAGLSIDNIYVDIDAEEVPIMDGSAGPFVFLIQSAGILEENAAKYFIRINKKIEVRQDDKYAILEPFHGFKVSFLVDYDHPLFHNETQKTTLDFSNTSYVKEISRARTFGFLSQLEYLRANNLSLGGSLDNVIVIDSDRVLNEDGLRYPDEFVRHKILDAVGDLYLLGHNILGAFIGHKSGHTLNNQLLRALLSDPTAWEKVSFKTTKEVPISFLPKEAVAVN